MKQGQGSSLQLLPPSVLSVAEAFHYSPDPVMVVDTSELASGQMPVVFCNGALEKALLGWRRPALRDSLTNWRAFCVSPAEWQRACEVLAGGGEFLAALQLEALDQSGFQLDLTGYPIAAHTGMRRYYLMVLRASQRSQPVDRSWRRLFDDAPEMLGTVRFTGEIDRLNRSLESALGYEMKGLDGVELLSIVHPDDQERIRAKLREAAETSVTLHVVARIRGNDEAYRRFFLVLRPYIDDATIFVSLRQIGERPSEQPQASQVAMPLFEVLPVGICRFDGERGIEFANAQFIQYFARDRHDITGLREEDLQPEWMQSEILDYHTLAASGSRVTCERMQTLESGEERYLRMTYLPEAKAAAPAPFYCLVEDVTDLRKAEEKTAASLRERELLLKEVHHRVKNNLQVIIGLLALQAAKLGEGPAVSPLNETQERIHAIALVHEMLYHSEDVARIQFSGFVRALASRLMERLGIDQNAIRLRTDIRCGPMGIDVAVPCAMLIHELFTNSLRHAFATGVEGEIAVQITVDAKQNFEMLVSDDGRGWPEGFDPAEAKTLGLRLVQVIARQLRGQLSFPAHSGARVSLVFPDQSFNRSK